MHRFRLLPVLIVIGLVACSPGSPPLPTPTASIAASPTVMPPTETVPPSPTASPTATVKPSDTPTRAPSATPTALPTSTPSATPRPSPTAIATLITEPTQAPTSSPTSTAPAPAPSNIPAPPINPFSPDLFISTLDKGHAYFIKFLQYHGKVSSGNIAIGSCYKFFNIRSEWASLSLFTAVPEAWAPLYTEYQAIREQVFVVTDPISQICGAGRGSISAETDQQILSFLDNAQNRFYELGQQARAMK